MRQSDVVTAFNEQTGRVRRRTWIYFDGGKRWHMMSLKSGSVACYRSNFTRSIMEKKVRSVQLSILPPDKNCCKECVDIFLKVKLPKLKTYKRNHSGVNA